MRKLFLIIIIISLYQATIPPKSNATLYLPVTDMDDINEKGKSISNWENMILKSN